MVFTNLCAERVTFTHEVFVIVYSLINADILREKYCYTVRISVIYYVSDNSSIHSVTTHSEGFSNSH